MLLNVGDAVRRIGGGPVMHIESIANGTAKCVWYADPARLKNIRWGAFALSDLEPNREIILP